MARPKQPLISRATAVAAAIEIIDSEGLEAFSLPRLARHMNVRAPSLYHHFQDKDALLAAVSRTIAAEPALPRKPAPENWPDWFVNLSLNFRQVVLRHRNAAPLLLQYLPREELTDLYDNAAGFLASCGVPARLHVQILDGMEKLTLGATITEAMRPRSRSRAIFPDVDPERQPRLAAALDANELTAKRLFEEMIRSFLRGVMDADAERQRAA